MFDILRHTSVKYGKLIIPPKKAEETVSKSTRLVIIDHPGGEGTKNRFSRSGSATLFSRSGEKYIALCRHQLHHMGEPNPDDINMLRILSEDSQYRAIPTQRAFWLKNPNGEEAGDILILKVDTGHDHWRPIDAPHFIPLASRKNKVADGTIAVGLPSSYSTFSYENYENPDFEAIHITRENILCDFDKVFASDVSFFHRCIIEDKERDLDGFSGGGIFTLARNRDAKNPEWEIFLDGIITRGGNGFIYYICWNYLNKAEFG